MEKKIIIVAEDRNQVDSLCLILRGHHYTTQHLQSFQGFEELPQGGYLVAVLIDLDTVSLSNLDVRNFKRLNQNVPLLAMSHKSFHPNLRESMRSAIYACISKPVDPEELIFLLNGAFENDASPAHLN